MGENADALKMQYLSSVTDRRIGREEIAGIACPVLYVEGERSPWRAHAMGDAFITCRPDAKRVALKGATHGMIWEDPRDFSRVCLEFFGHDTIAGE